MTQATRTNDNRLILSQSLIKAMDETQNMCPAKAQAIYIHGRRSGSTEAMNKGNYFETLVLGATKDGHQATMKKLDSGAKSTDQVRIEAQASQFLHRWTKEYQMDLHQAHVPLIVGLGERYAFRANLDVLTSMLDETVWPEVMPEVVVDVKLTQSLLTTFGPFAWGLPEAMDHLQGYAYSWTYEQIYDRKVPFYYFVVSYGPRPDHKRILLDVTPENKKQFLERLGRTVDLIENYDTKGPWPRVPGEQNCRTCPLKNECPLFRTGSHTQIVKV